MIRTPVDSSDLVSVGYDPTSLILEIEFKTGVYQYDGVPTEVYQCLRGAASVGRYFHAFIKNGYPARKVR